MRPEIFLAAHNFLTDNLGFGDYRSSPYCCDVLDPFSTSYELNPEQRLFTDIFWGLDRCQPQGGWWGDDFKPEDQEARRLALLFAYEIAKDGGL